MQSNFLQKLKFTFWLVFNLSFLTIAAHSWRLSWPLAFLAALVVYVVLFIWSYCGIIKKTVLGGMNDEMRHASGKPEVFPLLNRALLETRTREFLALGFSQLDDFTLVSDSKTFPAAFGRLFAHPTQRCFAEAGQAFPVNGKPIALGCTIMSRFEEKPLAFVATIPASTPPPRNAPILTPPSRALNFSNSNAPIPDPAARKTPLSDDLVWTLSTTDRKPDAILWALRSPRKLVSRHTGATPSELLEIHLRKRGEMERVLGVPVSSELSLQAYRVRIAQTYVRLRRRMEEKNPVLFVYDWKFSGARRTEWWGEYSRRARKQRAS